MTNPFITFQPAELAALRASYLACLTAIATAGQSYTVAGRQFTRASIGEVKEILAQIGNAQARQSGKRARRTYSDFRRYDSNR